MVVTYILVGAPTTANSSFAGSESKFMKVTARSVMTSPVLSVQADTPLENVFALLLRHHISGLPVVDKENLVVGVITEHDLLHLLFTPESPAKAVSELCCRDVLTVGEDQPLFEVADMLLTRGIRRVPVVDDEGHLVGIISRRDLVRATREFRQRIAIELEMRKEAKTNDRSDAETVGA